MSAAADQPTPYADAAMLYREAGWSAPIPVRGKYPPPSGWTGSDGGWPSYPDVTAWCEDRGHDNIGLRLPPTVLGIDVDNYGDKRGAATLAACEQRWGALPETWRSTSRPDSISGIRLFSIPAGAAWPGQLPGGGVELVRWDHRYAMVWPSIHPEGRVYRWTRGDGVVSLSIPKPSDLPKLPVDWIIGLVRGPERHEDKADIESGARWVGSLPGARDRPCQVMSAALAKALAEVRFAGSRHDAMTTAQLDLVRLAESGHPGGVAVLDELGETFVGLITDRAEAGTARAEYVRALDGACARVAAAPTWPPGRRDPCTVGTGTMSQQDMGHGGATVGHTAIDPETGEPVPLPHPLVQERMNWLRADKEARALLLAEESPLDALPVAVSLTEFLATPDEPITDRIGSLLPIGARVVLAAQMKAGKTTLVGNLIHSLADGDPFLGAYPVTPPTGNVVLLDNEMDARTLRRWLREMAVTNTDGVRLVSMIGRVGGFDIRIPRIFDYWVKTLAEMNTTALIVDCLKPILDTLDLDERSETGKITTPLTRLKTEAGISELILVHHMGHSGERSRGDSALRGWPEVEWQLVRLAEQPDEEPDMDAPRYLKAYGRDVNIPETQLQFDADTRRLSTQVGTRKEARLRADAGRLERLILEAVRAEPGINSTSITAALKGARGWGRKGTETTMLGDLVHRSVLRMEVGGHNAKHYFLGQMAPVSPVSPVSPKNPWGASPNPSVWGGLQGGTPSPPSSPELDFRGEDPADE